MVAYKAEVYRAHSFLGPYRSYFCEVKFDGSTKSLHGSVVGTRDVIAFETKGPESVEKAFHDAVDDYIDWCKKRGLAPEKPHSGRFQVRITPELHHRCVVEARRAGESLNSFVNDCIETTLRFTESSKA
jgi:predicted HicB family RNase H-like nuclease